MKSKVIYFPYIKVPETAWFSRVLLYWDSVASIVPIDYVEEPDRLGPYMKGLVKERLVEQIHPGMYLWRARNFVNAFLDHVDLMKDKGVLAEHWDYFRIHEESMAGARVHMEKLDDLGEELVNRRLARRVPRSAWYDVEPNVARHFMAYLAGVLGRIAGDDGEFCPITDDAIHLAAIAPAESQASPLHSVVLEKVLPAPRENLEPARLAEFKARYSDELLKFRAAMEEEVSLLSAITDGLARSKRTVDAIRRLCCEREEIVRRMAEQKKWPALCFGDICAVGGGAVAVKQAVDAGDLKLGLIGAAFAIAPAIYSAFKGEPIDLKDSPLAYAALAERQLQDVRGQTVNNK